MYIFYVLLFMAGLIAVSDWRGDARASADMARAEAVATQMASYHQQVLAFCQQTTCAPGPVLPGLARVQASSLPRPISDRNPAAAERGQPERPPRA